MATYPRGWVILWSYYNFRLPLFHSPSCQPLPASCPHAVGQEVNAGVYDVKEVLGDGEDGGGAEGLLVGWLQRRGVAAGHTLVVTLQEPGYRCRTSDACNMDRHVVYIHAYKHTCSIHIHTYMYMYMHANTHTQTIHVTQTYTCIGYMHIHASKHKMYECKTYTERSAHTHKHATFITLHTKLHVKCWI